MKLVIMGSGTSNGIPALGCDCPVCASKDPKDKRSRASLYIEGHSGETAVIDTGPEFRIQALAAGIQKLDAVFITHAHADHMHGLDDVRPLSWENPIPVYCNTAAIKELRERFSYVFTSSQHGGGKPRIIPTEVFGPIKIGSLTFTSIPLKHGCLDIIGWRIDEITECKNKIKINTAVYLTDVNSIPATSMPLIGNPKILIIDGLRKRPHVTHFSFEESLNKALEIKAKNIYLTHICHDNSHREIMEYCGNFINQRGISGITMEPAWDGLVLRLD